MLVYLFAIVLRPSPLPFSTNDSSHKLSLWLSQTSFVHNSFSVEITLAFKVPLGSNPPTQFGVSIAVS